jgi:hypothetical protein
MIKMRLVLEPQAKKLGLVIQGKLKAHGYMLATTMNKTFGSTQKFKGVFHMCCVG